MRRGCRALPLRLSALLLALAGATAAGAQPQDEPCAAAPAVRLGGADAHERDLVCDGAAQALRFMATAGLRLPDSSQVLLVDELPGEMQGRAVGCYVRDTRRVMLLRWRAFQAIGEWMRMPVEPGLYRSAAAHEIAHAVVGCNADEGTLPVPAHEYVAYVVMFATMEPGLRARVLARFDGRGFDSPLAINTIVYVSNPLQFAADAWRHYLRRADGPAFLRDVVAGHVVPVFPTEGP